MNVIVTGYNGSGASAVGHFLREYDNTQIIDRPSYEHVLLHAPDGLFDLEYKLLFNNNMHRSDEALKSFSAAMNELYENDYRWCGGYQNILGEEFKKLVEEFIEAISHVSFTGTWFHDIQGREFHLVQIVKDTVKCLLNRPVNDFGKRTVRTNGEMTLSFIEPEEFYHESRIFIKKYMDLFKKNNPKITIFDHLIKPSDVSEFDKYFDEDTKVIIVERDLRDYYLYGKYIKKEKGNPSKFPKNVTDFVKFWKGMERLEKDASNPNVLRVQLEDLVFRTESTVNQIEEFLDLEKETRSKKGKYFSADKINEEILYYKKNDNWKNEVKILEKEFPHRIYDLDKQPAIAELYSAMNEKDELGLEESN